MSRFFGLLALAALLCLSTVSAQCGGAGYDAAGYDLSALSNMEFSYNSTDGKWIYSVAPCGIVRNATNCRNPNFPNTAVCQQSTNPTANGTSLAQYTAANSTWYTPLNNNGVVQEMVDGTWCNAEGGANGGGYREASIVYLCDRTATTPKLLNVSEIHTCFYTAYIATAATCTRTTNAATGPLAAVGTRYFDGRCGGGAYDLSPLQAYDLMWSPAPQFSNQTVWFLRVCGQVAHPNCTVTSGQGHDGIPTETAMLCQSDQTNPTGNDNSAAFYVPNQQMWTIPSLSGGLTMQIQDGGYCGSATFPREATINFVCDSSATTAVMTSVVEPITCYYTATVRTNLVCPDKLLIGSSTAGTQPQTQTSSSTGAATNPQPSSSSTGTVVVGPGGGGGNGAAATTVSAMVVAAVVAVVALML